MRRVMAFAGFLLTLGVIALGLMSAWGYRVYHAPGPLQEETIVMVERGQGVNGISATLSEAKIIEDPLLFRLAARMTNQTLKAGEYMFPAGASMAFVLDRLISGETYQRRVTIPEGMTSWQVVQILNRDDGLAGDPVADIPPDGSLLPETYHYVRGDTRQDLLDRMRRAMDETLEKLWAERQKGLPFGTKEEALAMAAIVEKETGIAGERARIAGVFINRLERGIPLQSDPTVIYALTDGRIQSAGKGPLGRRLLKKDLEVDSPYNTYKYPGLPPGPIANPGWDAIAATLHPEDNEYIYFVADGTGRHVFAKTLEEHNRNVAEWRRIRREKKL